MLECYEEEINVYKNNLSRRLAKIGFYVSELLISEKAQENNRLFRYLTVILSSVFKTYVSTQKLDYYFEPSIIKLSDVYYSDFKGYKTGIFIIISFNGKLTKFGFENTDYKQIYSRLNEEIKFLNKEFKVVTREYKRYMDDTELLK